MLQQLEIDNAAGIASWHPDGTAFCVHKHKKFVETVLPKYFRQSKYTSFQRQLNIYGFKRICQGKDTGSYYHPNFIRGKYELTYHIERVPVKQSSPSHNESHTSTEWNHNNHVSSSHMVNYSNESSTSIPALTCCTNNLHDSIISNDIAKYLSYIRPSNGSITFSNDEYTPLHALLPSPPRIQQDQNHELLLNLMLSRNRNVLLPNDTMLRHMNQTSDISQLLQCNRNNAELSLNTNTQVLSGMNFFNQKNVIATALQLKLIRDILSNHTN